MRLTYLYKFLLMGVLLAAVPAVFADSTLFDARGPVLFSDDFSGPAMAEGWVGKPGKWEIVEGAAKASEVPADKHAAVRRHPLRYRDAIFEFSFQFDGAKMIGLSLNNRDGHVCRLTISPRGLTLQVDQPNAKSDLKAVKLATSTTPVAPGTWHRVLVEVRGPKMLAQLDDGEVISGENPRVDVDKIDLGIPVAGVSAKIKDVRVYAVK